MQNAGQASVRIVAGDSAVERQKGKVGKVIGAIGQRRRARTTDNTDTNNRQAGRTTKGKSGKSLGTQTSQTYRKNTQNRESRTLQTDFPSTFPPTFLTMIPGTYPTKRESRESVWSLRVYAHTPAHTHTHTRAHTRAHTCVSEAKDFPDFPKTLANCLKSLTGKSNGKVKYASPHSPATKTAKFRPENRATNERARSEPRSIDLSANN